MRPQSDRFDNQVEAVVRELVQHGRDAGAAAIEAERLAVAHDVEKRAPLSQVTAATVYFRDNFCCRYCGARTILTPVMQLLGDLYPDLFPFHKNWKSGLTHPAVIARSSSVDHVRPGASSELSNLATACWPCNAIKSSMELELLGWTLQPRSTDESWDGLTRYYPDLFEEAGRPDASFHGRWIDALERGKQQAVDAPDATG